MCCKAVNQSNHYEVDSTAYKTFYFTICMIDLRCITHFLTLLSFNVLHSSLNFNSIVILQRPSAIFFPLTILPLFNVHQPTLSLNSIVTLQRPPVLSYTQQYCRSSTSFIPLRASTILPLFNVHQPSFSLNNIATFQRPSVLF